MMHRKDSSWEAAIYHRELSPVLCDNLEGKGKVVRGRLKKKEIYVHV